MSGFAAKWTVELIYRLSFLGIFIYDICSPFVAYFCVCFLESKSINQYVYCLFLSLFYAELSDLLPNLILCPSYIVEIMSVG